MADMTTLEVLQGVKDYIDTQDAAVASDVPVDITRTASDATLVNSDHDPLFYLRQANSSLAGLMTAAEHTKLGALPTASELYTGTIYDVSANNPTAGPDSDGKFTLEYILSHADTLIPASRRHGGMTISFVDSSDNKYVQYRLMSDSWSINTNDWSFCGDDVLAENPEWIYVLLDAKDRILAGLKSDGSVEWSIGVPAPVKAHIDEIKNGTKGTALDGLNKIIAFLSEFSTSDILKDLLNEKVDKEEGKSLIDEEYADGVHYIENPEFVEVITDKDGRIVWAIEPNGNIKFGAGVPQQVIDYVNDKIAELSLDEYEDIVDFLGNLINGEPLETLLEALQNGKQDAFETDKYMSIQKILPSGYTKLSSIIGRTGFTRIDTGIYFADDDLEFECTFKDSGYTSGGPAFGRYGSSTTANCTRFGYYTENGLYLINLNNSRSKGKVVQGPVGGTKLHVILNSSGVVINGSKTNLDFSQKGPDYDETIVINGYNLNNGTTERTIEWYQFIIRKAGVVIFNGIPCIRTSDNKVGLYDTVTNQLFGNALDNDENFVAGNVSNIQERLTLIDIDDEPDKDSDRLISSKGAAVNGYYVEDIEKRTEILTDSENRIISYRDEDGVLHENVGIETNHLELTEQGMSDFQQALKDAGFSGGTGDWSDYISNKGKNPLCLSVPRCAIVNITNSKNDLTWPQTKGTEYEGIVEFYDMEGNYFKKNIIFDAQGNSSMQFEKKNGSIKMFDGSVYNSKGKKGKGDKFSVKFGNWVPQNTYHIKAFYTDFFKGSSWVSYQVALAVMNTRPELGNRTWKQALLSDYTFTDVQFSNPQIDDMNLQMDNGALCQPDGFPCIVFLNGDFYGVYAWFIKKDAANFNMDEHNAKHIHLDGRIDDSSLFNGNGVAANILWNPANDIGFEIRNPEDKCLVVYDGTQYDADLNKNMELAGIAEYGDEIPAYDNNEAYSKGAIVSLNDRAYMSLADSNTGNDPEDALCTNPDEVFDDATDWWIDITFTNEVKKAILKFSKCKTDINNAVDTSAKKALFETYFDLDNMVDYEVVQEVTGDEDGTSKNWQWTTWDGEKWFVNNYDKDCTFGNVHTGMLTNAAPSTKSSWYSDYKSFNTRFLAQNYSSEIKDRWVELVQKGIFTKEYIISLFKDWMGRIGEVNFAKEYSKWQNAPCNRDNGINTEYWAYQSHVYAGFDHHQTYDATTPYTVNDTCVLAVGLYDITFKCVKDCTGQNPVTKTYPSAPTQLGYRDNLWRVYKYIEKRLNTINTFAESI